MDARDTSRYTKQRSIRIPNDLWKAAGDKAHAEGLSVADVIRACLADYLEGTYRP